MERMMGFAAFYPFCRAMKPANQRGKAMTAIPCSDTHQKFTTDIIRALILSKYINEWGQPEYRKILHTPKGVNVEIYFFPGKEVFRFSTVGLSSVIRQDGQAINCEWMLATSATTKRDRHQIFDYICDLIAHFIENCRDNNIPRIMGESKLAPKKWTAKGILIDELLGEDENLSPINIGRRQIYIRWLIPLRQKEIDFILKNGIEAFDMKVNESEISVIDPERKNDIMPSADH